MARIPARFTLFLMASLSLLLLASCTTQPKPPSACEIALSDCRDQLKNSRDELKQCQQNNQNLFHRRDQLDKHLEECLLSAQEDLLKQQEAQQQEVRLKQLLEQELNDRNVEIEYLKGRLTVRMLNRILFDSGSAEIMPSGQKVLDKLVQAIADSQNKIRVVGHTDNVDIGASLISKYPTNWELSAARASSVVRYFEQQHQIEPTRMEAVGLSKYHPLAKNDSEENRQRNRRVEIVLTALD